VFGRPKSVVPRKFERSARSQDDHSIAAHRIEVTAMSERLLKALPLGVFGSLLVVLTVSFSPAQEPIPLKPPQPDPVPVPLPVPGQVVPPAQPVPAGPPAPAQPDPAAQPNQADVEVLAKGPIHEAYAATAEAPAAAPVVAQQPPAPIEELPPDQKPAGDNVQWIPGYWSWDEETSKYIWVSGFWRQPPPGRVWVPGSWREVQGGSQWVSGFWQEVQPVQPAQAEQPVQPQIEYLPQPPASLETGPTVPAPGEAYFYAPGAWVWRGRYVWRPGVWVEYRTNWMYVPARYYWTPAGYVFCEGYWDYPLTTRGVLFAPVVFARPVYVQPTFVYTPVYVVSEPCMVGALFVRRGRCGYYFGDYYDPGYGTLGYTAWCGTYSRAGFSVGFGVGRSWGYDPLWSYYSVAYRGTPAWSRGVGELYQGRYRGDLLRPPTTLVQQNTTINTITKVNVTNVTNNITVVNGAPTVNNHNISNVAMVAPLKVAPDIQRTKYEPLTAETRRTEAVAARQIREVAVQRTKLETAAAAQPHPAAVPGQPAPAAQPRTIKLDVPKAAVARAQVRDEKKAPPTPVHAAAAGAKIDHQPGGQPPVQPAHPAGVAPAHPPGVGPAQPGPKVEPKQPYVPKVELPKVNLPGPAGPAPKVDPHPAVPLPKAEPPKVPGPPSLNPAPKLEPPHPLPVVPKIDPKMPPHPLDPKAEPPKGPTAPGHGPMVPAPKGPPPKVDPKTPPKVDPKAPPKGDPPRPPVVLAPPVPHPAPPAPHVAAKVPVPPPVQPHAPPQAHLAPPAPVVHAPVVHAPPQPPHPVPPAPVVHAPPHAPPPVAHAPPTPPHPAPHAPPAKHPDKQG
jgi:hypothetical protein